MRQQHELGLEKKWIVKAAEYAPWFHINTTIIGMSLVDTMKGVSYMVESNHPLKNVMTKTFTGAIINAIRRMDLSDSAQPTRAFVPSVAPVGEVTIPAKQSPVSLITTSTGSIDIVPGDIVAIPPDAPSIPLDFLQMHTKIQTVASGKCNHGDCRAKGCKGKSQYQCSNLSCGKWYCDPDTTRNGRRYCFYLHIAEQYIVHTLSRPRLGRCLPTMEGEARLSQISEKL